MHQNGSSFDLTSSMDSIRSVKILTWYNKCKWHMDLYKSISHFTKNINVCACVCVCVCVCVCESHSVPKSLSFLSMVMYQLLRRGQRCPCHFLCQRSWMTCGKDTNQGRLIYVPALFELLTKLFPVLCFSTSLPTCSFPYCIRRFSSQLIYNLVEPTSFSGSVP